MLVSQVILARPVSSATEDLTERLVSKETSVSLAGLDLQADVDLLVHQDPRANAVALDSKELMADRVDMVGRVNAETLDTLDLWVKRESHRLADPRECQEIQVN